jgi:hypothetical protein
MISATLSITINNENDNAPVFSPVEKLSFKEGTAEGQLVGIIIAIDPDDIDNNNVTYELLYVHYWIYLTYIITLIICLLATINPPNYSEISTS